MKRAASIVFALALGVVGSLSTSGCEGVAPVDEVLLAETHREIANVGSQATLPGPRSQAQVDRAVAQVASLQANVERLARRQK